MVCEIYQISRKEHEIFRKMPNVPYKLTHFVFWNPPRTRFVTFSWQKKSGDESGLGDKSGCDKSEDEK